jgi:hypothetical protein
MGQPLPPEIILPTGQAAYLNPYKGTYTTSRSYAMRMQRGFRLGRAQQQARRGGEPGQSESQVRAFRFEQRYGFSYLYWRRLQRKWISEINSMSSPGGRITPEIVSMDLANLRSFPALTIFSWGAGTAEQMLEQRLEEKLEDMISYREGDSEPGHYHFVVRNNYRPIELWWYH